jgi:hypothetical protein
VLPVGVLMGVVSVLWICSATIILVIQVLQDYKYVSMFRL